MVPADEYKILHHRQCFNVSVIAERSLPSKYKKRLPKQFMRHILYFFALLILSCQQKNNQPKKSGLTDTLQNPSIIEPNPQDTSTAFVGNIKDTIFLGFRTGMTRSEFEKHKQELIRSNKLKSSGNGLTYQIKVDENQGLSLFTSKEDDIPKKIWTGSGDVIPEFLDDKLISITLNFLNTKGSNVYSYFETNLNHKYYKSNPDPRNFFANNKQIDTLQVGNTVNWFISNKWTLGDINISLRYDHESLKISDKKIKATDDVVLKYWSEMYYSLKQDEKTDEAIQERIKMQDDL